MDFKDTLAKIDAALGKTITFKTKAEAEAYVNDQIAKAKAEGEEEDKEAGAAKAKKRLAHLRENLIALSKASWDGQANSLSIPVYEWGYESDLTAKTDKSETEQKTPPAGNTGTQGPGAPIAGAGGAQGFAKSIVDLQKSLEGLGASEEKPKKVEKNDKQEERFDWPNDLANPNFLKEGVTKRAEEWGLDGEKAPAR